MHLPSPAVPLAACLALAASGVVGPVWAQEPAIPSHSNIVRAGAALLFVLSGAVVFLALKLRGVNRRTSAEVRRSSAILNQSGDGIVGLGKDMSVRFINPAARHMLGGLSRDIPFEWPVSAVFHAQRSLVPLGEKETPLARAIAGERVYKETFALKRGGHEGKMRFLRITCVDLFEDPSGAVLLVTMTDVTSEEASKGNNRDSKDDVFARLSLGIMNDFNNALATIAYAIDLSLKHSLPEKPTSFLMTALGTVERGQRLTDQMLRFAERGRAPHLPCIIKPMFDELQVLVGPAVEPGVTLSFDCDDPNLVLHCNQTHLETTLVEMLVERSGALTGLGFPGRIRVGASEAGPSKVLANLTMRHTGEAGFVEITVSDNGPPLPETVVTDLETPWSQDSVPSVGAGEAFNDARRFADSVGGELRLISNGVEGVTLGLVLPVEPGGSVPPPIWQARPERGQGETVFVVEDEASLLLMLQEELEDLGYRVISATSGVAALGLIEQGVEFDLVITDIVLPGEINGFDLAAKIQDLRHGAAVLYMSGYTGFGKADMGPAKAPILKKPAPPAELARAVRSVLAKRMH